MDRAVPLRAEEMMAIRTLKDQMRADVDAVFLNTSEFAVPVVIEGIQTNGVWTDTQQPYKDYHHDSLPRLPLDVDEHILQVADGLVEVLPQQEIEVNGEMWNVRKALPRGGMLTLYLYRNVGF